MTTQPDPTGAPDGAPSVAALIDRLAAARGRLSPAVKHEARRALLNALGVMLGVDETAPGDIAAAAGAPGQAQVPGRAERLDRYSAARVAGISGHVDDFDDTHLATVIHPGTPVVAALVGLGLDTLDPAALLDAIAIGIEVQLRIGLAMTPWHYARGWHITGTCGVIGAAVAAGVAKHRTAAQLAAAAGLAARLYVGHREGFGSMVKSLNVGAAAAGGLLAHDLAAGLAPADAAAAAGDFEAEGGYFALLSGTWDQQWLRRPDDLGQRWLVLDNSYKPYPCGVVAHPAIEAAIGLHPVLAPGLHPERAATIEAVEVRCHPLVPDLMGKLQPRNGLEGRFSAVHGVAAGLVEGKAGLRQFSDEGVRDPAVAAVRDRVVLQPQADCGRASATVRLRLGDGRYFEAHVANVVSSISRPLTDAELSAKFTDLVAPVFGPAHSASLLDAVWHLGTGTAPDGLVRALAALPGRPGRSRPPVPRPNEGARTDSARLASFAAGTPLPELPARARAQAREALAEVRAAAAQLPPDGDDPAPEYLALALARAAAEHSPQGSPDLARPAAAAVVALGLSLGPAGAETAEAAVAAGLAACSRIAAALHLDEHPHWLAAGSLGQVAAALAAARVLALDRTKTLAALGIAATLTSGLAAPAVPSMAWLQPAKAASDGVLAARLARAGLDGPAAPIEGPRGLGVLWTAAPGDTAAF